MHRGMYTTQLQAGLGLIAETRRLLCLWEPGMSSTALYQAALKSGQFPNVSARRLMNVVRECFAPRYLVEDGKPAQRLKQLDGALSPTELSQLFFLHTCRANLILADFVRTVYWSFYAAGRDTIGNDDAREFVLRANQEGRTAKPWSASTIRRVAGYLTGCCAGLPLARIRSKKVRKILPYRIEPRAAAVLAYEMHFAGRGDNAIVADPDWALFGMDQSGILDEFKRLALKGLLIVQTAADVTRIAWPCKNLKELADVLAQS